MFKKSPELQVSNSPSSESNEREEMSEEEQEAGAEKPKWPKKPPKTEADLAAIAYLDKLRAGGGDPPPKDVPLACIVKVTEYENVPKANEAYAMVRVVGADGKTWRLCVHRGTVKVGKNALFISDAAALPVEDRFRNPAVCTVKEKVYKYGFGVKVRRLLPHVQRHIYPLNCGVLYPTSAFAELKGKRAGIHVAVLLHIDRAEELKIRQQDPHAWVRYYQPES